MTKVSCFGEVLWDVFPTHKKIGGAPLNVALRLNSFGVETSMISRIGNDVLGSDLLDYMVAEGLDVTGIQRDTQYKTGEVLVQLDQNGSASYTIEYPAAWDKIEYSNSIEGLVKSSDAFIFGSLACRDEQSKKTLLALLEIATFKVFDLNLRPPFYELDLIKELMGKADFIKCNDEELDEICLALGNGSENIEDKIKCIVTTTNTTQVCVTLGKDGAMLYDQGKIIFQKAYPVTVIDTVGAGDSFLATLIHELLKKTSSKEALDFACKIGAFVAGKEGANPKLEF